MNDPRYPAEEVRDRVRRIVRFLMLAPFIVTIFLAVFGYAVLYLWNWLMPMLFALPAITFWQGWGLMVLSWILLGGFRGLGGHGRSAPRGGSRRGNWERWRRWREMTPEQRAALREALDRVWEKAPDGPSAAAPER